MIDVALENEVGASMTPRQERIQAWRERSAASALRRRIIVGAAIVGLLAYVIFSVAKSSTAEPTSQAVESDAKSEPVQR